MDIEFIMSELDFRLIEKVRELRIKSKISQVVLSQKIGVSEGYIGNIENHRLPNKYNIRLLARVAIALELKSYIELFPEEIYSNDLVRIKIELFNKEEIKLKGKSSEIVERFKSLSIKPLTENEIVKYDKDKTSIK